MNKKLSMLALAGMVSLSSFAVDSADIIKQVRKGKFEEAIKSRSKLKSQITDSKEKLLYDISECLLYNSPKYAQYNPKKAYQLYINISYSDYIEDRYVTTVLKDNKYTMESIRLDIENNLMDYAKKKGTVYAYDEIIELCQGCSYIADANKMKENLVYENTLRNASVSDVEQYIADYPDSPNKAKAIALRDSLAYVKLPESADAYSNYISMYPDSKWVPTLKASLEKMAYNEAKEKNTINAYARYIVNYPENKSRVTDFQEKIVKLQSSNSWLVSPKYRDIAILKDTTGGKVRNYYAVSDGVWGVLDDKGVQIVMLQYQELGKSIEYALLPAKKNGKWGVIDITSGREIGSFQMSSIDDIKVISKNFIAIRTGGAWGLMGRSGEVVIAPFVQGALTPYNMKKMANGGVAMTYQNNLIIVDGEGKQLLNKQYDEVTWRTTADIDSRFIKMRTGKKYGLIGDYGQVILDEQFDMPPYFDNDGVSSVKNLNKEGWIDTTGAFLYNGPLTEFRDCGEDKIVAYEVSKKWGFIDKVNKQNIDRIYDELGECFNHGLAKVRKGSDWIYINKAGQEIYTLPSSAKSKYAGQVIVVKNGSSITFVETTGQTKQLSYDDCDDAPSCGYVRVKKNDKWGAVDAHGYEAVAPAYDDMTKYCNGYSIVKKNGKFGLLYKTTVVIEPMYDKISDEGHFFDADCEMYLSNKTSNVFYVLAYQGSESKTFVLMDGKSIYETKVEVRLDKPSNKYTILKCSKSGIFSNARCGLINPDGKVIVKPTYLNLTQLPENPEYYIYTSRTNKKQGILNSKGKEVTQPIADKIISFDGKVIYAENNGDKTYFDAKGSALLPAGFDVEDNVLKNKKDGKYGVVDDKGNIKVYTTYNKVVGATSNTAVVNSDGKYGILKF